MTEEIKYYKEKEYPLKWIPAEEMEETPQQTIARLEQENKELNFKINQLKANGLYNDLTGIELSAKVVELEEENKELKSETLQWKQIKDMANNNKYRSALEEIRTYLNTLSSVDSDFTNTETYLRIQDKINEVLNE